MNWQRLADEVIRRRTHLGYATRREFAEATGFATKTLGDLEKRRRSNFDRVTLAKLEKALQWPEGRVQEILATPSVPQTGPWRQVMGMVATTSGLGLSGGDGGRDAAVDPDGTYRLFQVKHHAPPAGPPHELLWQLGLESPPDPAPGQHSLAEILRLIHRDDFPLAVLLFRSGLDQASMLRVILRARARREEQATELLHEVAELVREAGGVAPDPVWPPTWLMGEVEDHP